MLNFKKVSACHSLNALKKLTCADPIPRKCKMHYSCRRQKLEFILLPKKKIIFLEIVRLEIYCFQSLNTRLERCQKPKEKKIDH